MPITTLDGIIAGARPPQYFLKAGVGTPVVGRPQSYWATFGNPGAGTFNALPAGAALSSTGGNQPGQIWHVDPVSGETVLARFKAQASQPGTLLLCDRLWSSGGYNNTLITAQTVASVAFPARDEAGTTNGKGVQIGLEVSVASGAGAPVATISYTNELNVAGKTMANFDSILAPSIAGSFYRFTLAAGDYGVRSVQSLTLSATMTSGTINLVAYTVIADMEITAANIPNAIDALLAGSPRIKNGAVPFLIFIPSSSVATNITGSYIEAQG